MNTNIIISLDKRRKKKDGSYPLIMRLTHNSTKTTSISLGVSVPENYWDDKKKLVKKTYKGVSSVTRLNNLILKKKAEAMSIIAKLEEKDVLRFLSIKQLKDRIVKKNDGQSVFVYGEQLVKEMMDAKRIGNARSYRAVLSTLKKYCKGGDLTFEELNYEFLLKWERSHLSNGNTINGFASYMRTIRAIYNRAIKAGLVEKQAYPFDDYKIKLKPTDKRAIDVESLKKIMNAKIEKDHPLFHPRNMFIASYLLYGMNFIDMAFLKKSDIIGDRIKYRRKKTAKLYDIKITDQLKEILNFYLEGKKKNAYIFDIIKRKELELQYKDVAWARGRFNKALKKLAEFCGIEENLTSYVARHSFATQAMMQDVPLQAISAMLGHSKLSTTQVYLAELPTEVLDGYHDRLRL